MAGGPLHRPFNPGAVGTRSDAQLLDLFPSRRDEAAEAAFEELVTRHGPMVLRVCRGILRDPHDAEGAFQAVFLVPASRAVDPAERRAAAGSAGSSPSGRRRAPSRTRTPPTGKPSTKRSTACPSGCGPRSCSATCKG